MQIFTYIITIFLILLNLSPLLPGKNLVLHTLNDTNTSPWLIRFKNPRFVGCWRRPWICNRPEDFQRIRWRCCRNRCIDVNSDVNNCGLCGIRCPFTWQCCRGICVNTNRNPFHCGRCEHRCRFPALCFYGMCGYALPFPPKPFPPRPRPRPPKGGRRRCTPPPPVVGT